MPTNRFSQTVARILGLGLLVTLAVVPLAAQSPEQSEPERDVSAIRQQQPGFLVRAEVDHPSRIYREGDTLALKVVSEEDAFLYVLYQRSDGESFQIFPNSEQPDNRIRARQAVQVPASEDLFRWIVSPPFGREIVKVIATKKPLEKLADPELKQAVFNSVSPQLLKGVELELGEELPLTWSEVDLEISTVARDQTLASSGKKRFGVFFGVADYQFNTEVEAVSDGKTKLNLPTCHRDARRLAEVLGELGQLSGTKVFTNETATRANLGLAITGWLPAVSRPGDTVIIYFSGHGMQISDDGHDERDHQDELLVPYDYISLDVLLLLFEQAKAGKLDGRHNVRLAELLPLVKSAGSVEKAAHMLTRRTAVSDDLFAHWLQKLDGRQVIVILDVCHAGGFAAQEKDLFALEKPKGFDFLDAEMGRLKDLGQRESALLLACGAQETAAVREQNDLSVLTHYLVEGIVAAPSSYSLENAERDCDVTMQAYFEELNRARISAGLPPRPGHRPLLYNNCTLPALLRP